MKNIFAFNGNQYHQSIVKKYLDQFQIDVVVETGTLHGWTTAFFSDYVEQVHTIEVRDEPLVKARELLKTRSNIHIHHGNSAELLPPILNSISPEQFVLFYLDAHWLDYWPLFDELNIIKKCGMKKIIIMIDDFKVPGTTYSYDSYNGISNDIETVGPYLTSIFGEYSYDYFDGDDYFEMVLDEESLDAIDRDIYREWFRGKRKNTTGKIIAYEKC